jgi:NDP-sugar pyrophosphorylase family protein
VPAERTKPWGTTQAILMAADAIKEPFAVINADDFYGAESYQVMSKHLQAGTGDCAMVGFVLRNTLSEFGTVARGVCRVGGDGFLEQVVELTAIARDGDHAKDTAGDGTVTMLTGDEPVSMNMFGFTPQVFGKLQDHFKKFLEANGADLKKECYIPSTVNEMLVAKQAKVKVLRSNDSWFGVTYREDHAHVVESIRKLVKDGKYPESLWA